MEYLTYNQIQGLVGREVGDSFSSNRTALIQDKIQLAYDEVATRFNWPTLLRSSEATLSLASGLSYLYLPKAVDQLLLFYPDGSPNFPRNFSAYDLFSQYPLTATTQGLTTRYAHAGELGRKADFSITGEQITLSATGQTGTFDAVVHGMVGDDEVQEELANITTAGITTTSVFTDLIAISTNGSQTVPVVVTGATSATEYATIAINERTAHYKRIRLYQPTDGSSSTYTIWYKKKVAPLVKDNQVPEIPVSRYLVYKAIALNFASDRRFASGATYHDGQAERAIEDAIAEMTMQSNMTRVAAPRRNLRIHGGRRVVLHDG